MSSHHPLLAKYPIISDQIEPAELSLILSLLQDLLTKNPSGDVCELGCFCGTTSLFLQRLITGSTLPHKKLYLYDSFEGLPNKETQDTNAAGTDFQLGQLSSPKSTLIKNFQKANLPLPKIKKSWFSDLKPSDLPDQICFAFLDGDFYQSILDSLRLVYLKLTPGALVIVDDYDNPSLPGAKTATDLFLQTHPKLKLKQIAHSLAILTFDPSS
jgi:O-methyltransferase